MKERSNYKATWEQLARSMEEAKIHVAGYTEEQELDKTARHTIQILARTVGIQATDTILESGWGIGRVGNLLRKKKKKWIGTDISRTMLTHAQKRLAGLKNIELFELQTVGLNGIPDNSIDMVYCTVVFMHLLEWDRYRYVLDSFRILKPGGRCFFDNVDILSPHGWKVFMEGFACPPLKRPPHLSMVSSGDELKTYALKEGFAQVQIHRWDDAWVGVTGIKGGEAH